MRQIIYFPKEADEDYGCSAATGYCLSRELKEKTRKKGKWNGVVWTRAWPTGWLEA